LSFDPPAKLLFFSVSKFVLLFRDASVVSVSRSIFCLHSSYSSAC